MAPPSMYTVHLTLFTNLLKYLHAKAENEIYVTSTGCDKIGQYQKRG